MTSRPGTQGEDRATVMPPAFYRRRRSSVSAAQTPKTVGVEVESAPAVPAHVLPGNFSAAEVRQLTALYSRHQMQLGTLAGVERALDAASLTCAPMLIEGALERVGVPLQPGDRKRLSRHLSIDDFFELVGLIGMSANEAPAEAEQDRRLLVEVLQDLNAHAHSPADSGAQTPQLGEHHRGGRPPENLLGGSFALPKLTSTLNVETIDPNAGVSARALRETLREFHLEADLTEATGLTPRPGSAGKPADVKFPILSLARALAEAGAQGGDGPGSARRGDLGGRAGDAHTPHHGRGKGHVTMAVEVRDEDGEPLSGYAAYVEKKRRSERRKAAQANIEHMMHGVSLNSRKSNAGMSHLMSASTASQMGLSSRAPTMMRSMRARKHTMHRSRNATPQAHPLVPGGSSGTVAAESTPSARRRSLALSIGSAGGRGDDPLLTSMNTSDSRPDSAGDGLPGMAAADSFMVEGQYGHIIGAYTPSPRRVKGLNWGERPRSPRPWGSPPKCMKAKTPDVRRRKKTGKQQLEEFKRTRMKGITDEELKAELRRRGLAKDAVGRIVPLPSSRPATVQESRPADAAPPPDMMTTEPTAQSFPAAASPGANGPLQDSASASLLPTLPTGQLPRVMSQSGKSATTEAGSEGRSPKHSPSQILARSTREILRAQRGDLADSFSPKALEQCHDEAAKLFDDGGSPDRRRQIARWLATKRAPGK